MLHSGIYYRPGSLKAITCIDGRRQMERFCRDNAVAWKKTGKVIVACDERELPRLDILAERGVANGVDCAILSQDELRQIEPAAAGISALHVRDAGVVDFRHVCHRLADLVGRVTVGAEALRLRQRDTSVSVETSVGTFDAAYVINCAGLHSDRVARRAALEPGVRIVPFRGEYYSLTGRAAGLCRTMIYPIPDPALPFLGVHFTRSVDDHVHCGPNAVPAFSREGYRWSDINVADVRDMVLYRGTRLLARRMWRTAIGEFGRSISKAAFVRAAQRLVPAIRSEDLVAAPAGVRAQAVGRDGSLIDDFLIRVDGAIVHVLNAPSPAATACFAIADRVVGTLDIS